MKVQIQRKNETTVFGHIISTEIQQYVINAMPHLVITGYYEGESPIKVTWEKGVKPIIPAGYVHYHDTKTFCVYRDDKVQVESEGKTEEINVQAKGDICRLKNMIDFAIALEDC